MPSFYPLQSLVRTLRLAAVPVVVIGVTVSLGMLFHVRGERVVEEQLRERMLSTVSIAAQQFDATLIAQVQEEEDMNTVAFNTLVQQLYTIRSLSPHVRFAYIMRRTDDPATLAFVADADALSSVQELDVNGNGTVDDDEEPGMPGDLYSIDEGNVLQSRAFLAPVVDEDITVDQWGRLISAYAPIVDEQGDVVAVLGLDIKADEFLQLTQDTFSIVAVLLVGLVGALLAAYVLIIIRSGRMESLKQMDEERSALIDLAMHQLGMPLATFKWWMEILRERDKGTFCKEGDVCDQLQQGIDRMDMIIAGLREASELQSDMQQYRATKTSIVPVVKKVVDDVHTISKTRKQTIVLDIAKDIPAVKIDRKLFAGMLRELLENASFYSPDNAEIVLRVRTVRGGVELCVEDKGYGIPKEDLPHIFQKFRRGSNAMKYKPAGNGLGLYIVKSIVEKAKGRVRIESTQGKGTSIFLQLPAA